MTLARLGAEVIKVEVPGRGDPVRGNGPFAGPEGIVAEPPGADYIATRFLKRSQGVKSVTLDLKNARGRELFLRMAEQSDIVLENLAPGAMTRLGLGYEEVAAANPGVIYASISGYGQTGPYAGQPGSRPADTGDERADGHQRGAGGAADAGGVLHWRPGYADVRGDRHFCRHCGSGTARGGGRIWMCQ